MPAKGAAVPLGPWLQWGDTMNETDVLRLIRARIKAAGDDAAVVPFGNTNLILTTDMLHRKSDFPAGTTPRTIGWRSVAVSLSDLAAMGARPLAVMLALGDRDLERHFVEGVLEGAIDCCTAAGTRLVGGDVDRMQELTLTGSAIGEARRPVKRSGAMIGDLVCVTGLLGRTAAGLALFSSGMNVAANDMFCLMPRIAWGQALAACATSMIDISDGVAHSLHLIASESGVGFSVEWARMPVDPVLADLMSGRRLRKAVLFAGEDYELLFTVPADRINSIDPAVDYSVIGEIRADGALLDDARLPDRGYEH